MTEVEEVLGGGLLPHGLQHGLHLLPLPLGQVVGPDPLLQELQAPEERGEEEKEERREEGG